MCTHKFTILKTLNNIVNNTSTTNVCQIQNRYRSEGKNMLKLYFPSRQCYTYRLIKGKRDLALRTILKMF